jgi:hypothetical protein
MGKSRNARRGGGVLTDQQFFNPDFRSPVEGLTDKLVTTAPTMYEIRPVLQATTEQSSLLKGGARHTRKRGGFSPSLMGSFVANAQSAIVPLALYAVYHTFVPKKGSDHVPTGGKKNNVKHNAKNNNKTLRNRR